MTYKVIQWGAGNSGTLLLQQIIANPDLDLVGLYVASAEKEGLDAGELCGRSSTGIRATRDKRKLLELEADCVFHNARASFDMRENDDDIVALLASGKNVITIMSGYFAPSSRSRELADRIDAACRIGSSTLFATGLAPGIVNWLAVVASGMSAVLEELSYTEIYDPSPAPRANILDILGMGKAAAEFTIDSPRSQNYFNKFTDLAFAYAAALSCRVTHVERNVRVGLATRDLQIAAGLVREGTVAAVAWTINVMTEEGPRIRCASQRIVQQDLAGWSWSPGWSARLELKGKPSATITFSSAPEDIAKGNDLIATVTAQLRAVPQVVAAAPGVLLPHVFGAWSPKFQPR